jgi:DNA polymerase III subunit gamma/tau
MGQALYRTYRSKKLSEIVGQEHITLALERALKNGTLSHAYLFTGPRGTGKTSIARILAHEINQLPYTEDRQHLDIIEIDAASNRRIDEIRDLRDKVHIAPSSAKYKVYIIDEVHMLTKEAFNALLKTLEEPPAHVIFILATTEVHKLPETIISRTQRFAFKPVELPKVTTHLRSIADTEKIAIDDAALELIAAHGEGSFRDSISLLDQARHAGKTVTLADVQAILGIAPAELIDTLLQALNAHDPAAVAAQLLQLREQGYEPAQIARQLSAVLRAQVISRTCTLPHDVVIKLLGQLVQVPASPSPGISLEIALLDAALAPVTGTQTPVTKPIMAAHTAHASPAPIMTMPQPPVRAVTPAAAKAPAEPKPFVRHAPEPTASVMPISDLVIDSATWHNVLAQLKKQHAALYGTAKATKVSFEPGAVILHFNYGFHQKRFNDKQNKEIIIEAIRTVVGQELMLRCVIDEAAGDPNNLPPLQDESVHAVAGTPETKAGAEKPAPPAKPVTDAKPASEAVATISNIFGGAEVLES